MCVSHGFQTSYERGFCNGLASNGIATTLISSDRTDYTGLLEGVDTLNLRRSQNEERNKWQKLTNLFRYHIKLLRYTLSQRHVILHVFGLIDPPLLLGVMEGMWFRLMCERYVLTVHNLLPHDKHTLINKGLYSAAYRIPHKLVVHTERMRRELSNDFGIDKAKIFVMEHGIEPHLIKLTDFDIKRQHENPVILFFGTIAPYKGLDILIEALQRVSFDFKLVIAGTCVDDVISQQIKALTVNPAFQHRLDWHDGYLDDNEVERRFMSADLLALPYRHIDQSGVLFQALRFGLSVLATRVGQFDRYVTYEVGELAEPENVDDLVLALERWFLRRSDFSRSQIREIGEAYIWLVTVRALAQVYEEGAFSLSL